MTENFEDIVARVIAAHQPSTTAPWSPRDDDAIERELHRVVQTLGSELKLEFLAEFAHYGSGYASFVDAWFFRRDPSFRRSAGADHYTGLVVLLCRLAPFYCFLEGEKAWNSKGSSSYLPAFGGVDAIATDAVRALCGPVDDWLRGQGYVRLGKSAVAGLLPEGVAVPTILTDPPYREFDALFHWED